MRLWKQNPTSGVNLNKSFLRKPTTFSEKSAVKDQSIMIMLNDLISTKIELKLEEEGLITDIHWNGTRKKVDCMVG